MPARGRRIESGLGRVWITIDGDPRNIVLEPGEGFKPKFPVRFTRFESKFPMGGCEIGVFSSVRM